MNKIILTTVLCLFPLFLFAMDSSGLGVSDVNGHAIKMHATQTVEPQTTRSKCEAIVQKAVKRGAQDFTKAMITNLAKQLIANKQFKDMDTAKRCIIDQLKEMRIPFQF
jgi:hypothetical protein